MPWPFTWDEKLRQYRGARGRIVPRTAVRQALDEAIDGARRELGAATRRLQAGTVSLPAWQIEVEGLLKSIHVMSAAVAAGGWAQAKPADWSVAAVRTKAAYAMVERLARGLESGKYDLSDGRLVSWVTNLGGWGSGTYEVALRKRDLATGRVIAERRLIHSGHPCKPCLGYHALGWQPPGTLPDIGQECLCRKFCRCTFERRWAEATKGKGGEADRPRPRPRRPAIDVPPGIAARRRPQT